MSVPVVLAAGLAIVNAAIGTTAQAQAPAPAAPPAAAPAPAAKAVEAPAKAAEPKMNPIENLAGKWTGHGALETSTGTRETVKCVANYDIKSNSTVIIQTIRCASASYKIDALTQMKVTGDKITGNWTESSFGTTGSVTGHVRAGGFNVVVDGGLFSARMTVAAGKGSQTLNILPAGLAVSRISIGFKRS